MKRPSRRENQEAQKFDKDDILLKRVKSVDPKGWNRGGAPRNTGTEAKPYPPSSGTAGLRKGKESQQRVLLRQAQHKLGGRG